MVKIDREVPPQIAALFDKDPDLIGVPVGGSPVSHIDDIVEGVVRRVQDDPTNRAVVGAPAAELVNRFVDKASEMADEAGLA